MPTKANLLTFFHMLPQLPQILFSGVPFPTKDVYKNRGKYIQIETNGSFKKDMSYVIFMKKKRNSPSYDSWIYISICGSWMFSLFAVKHFIFNAVCGRVEIERGNLYSSSYVRSMTDTVDIKFNDTSINYYLFSVY